MADTMFEFRCPKCRATPHEHGRGAVETCINRGGGRCEGLICDCDSRECPKSDEKGHGESLANPCTNANCYHCGWGGTVPVAPKGLQTWERKALAAGWTPPDARAKELRDRGTR